ncbi:hypothetical protein PSHT_06630 [Puccinia striiformis]|uniref:Retrotransposon gag domain-containing protein n=1 Tax=Puccinia striiformis TaxID=27350 RepID=A0A2S4W4A0_9BASI|nr:hypothetical protein PSHT_06630 [Puccinia striiformis]
MHPPSVTNRAARLPTSLLVSSVLALCLLHVTSAIVTPLSLSQLIDQSQRTLCPPFPPSLDMSEHEGGTRTDNNVTHRFGRTLELTDPIEALPIASSDDLATMVINTRSGLATQQLRAPTNRGCFDSLNHYFSPEGDPRAYQCNWCSKTIWTPMTSRANLRYHRDGSLTSGHLRAACPSRRRVIALPRLTYSRGHSTPPSRLTRADGSPSLPTSNIFSGSRTPPEPKLHPSLQNNFADGLFKPYTLLLPFYQLAQQPPYPNPDLFMSTRSTGLPLLTPTNPEAIIRAANAERRRLDQAALDPARPDSPTPSTPFRTPTESESSSIEHLSAYLVPGAQSDMSGNQPTGSGTADPPMDTNILEKTAGDTLPPAPDKSATTDEHLNRFLQIQNAGAIQMQEAIRAVLNLQRIDREAAAEERRESARRIALLEESLLRSTIKSEDNNKTSKVKSDRVDLLKLRFSDGPSYTGPPQAIKPFLQWITGLQIFFDSKAISHPADKIIVAGGLLKTTALLSFYANEGKDFAEKTWEEFKKRLFEVALPVRWRTTLKTSVRQLKMSATESFVDFSTRGRTLQAMINFDAASNLPDEALAEYVVIGLSVELRGKANEWELLEANPFNYPHFEKRLAAFDEILKEQAPAHPPRVTVPSPSSVRPPDEVAWRVHSFLDSQGRCHFCKKTCGSLPGRCPHPMDKKWVDIPTSFVTPPKPADYKRPRAHDPAPTSAGRPTQPLAGRPFARAATVAAVDESPVPDTLAEEFESFPPPAFENAELSVISEQTIDTVDAVQLHKEDHLAPEYCTGDLTQTVDWRELAAVQEDVSSYGAIDFGRDPFAQPLGSLPTTADINASVAAFNPSSAPDTNATASL